MQYLVYLWYYLSMRLKIRQGYWDNYSSIIGVFGYNSGLSVVLNNIEYGYSFAKILDHSKREKLLKEAFRVMINNLDDYYYDYSLFLNYLKYYSKYAIIIINKDKEVESKILNIKDRLTNAKLYSDLSDDMKLYFKNNHQEQDLYSIGGKNSAPMDLVEEMYKIQAKGCPVPPKNGNQ